MVALLNPAATRLRTKERLAPVADRPPSQRADVIWDLHRTLMDPLAEHAAVKRAKAQLLRAVTAADDSLRIIVPPLATKDITRLPIHYHGKSTVQICND